MLWVRCTTGVPGYTLLVRLTIIAGSLVRNERTMSEIVDLPCPFGAYNRLAGPSSRLLWLDENALNRLSFSICVIFVIIAQLLSFNLTPDGDERTDGM